jgi:hypothetical protein
LIDPSSGLVTLNTGAGITYGDVLLGLTPSSADYTVAITCTQTVSTGNMALWARASSGANTNYIAYLSSVENMVLAKDVAGVYTQFLETSITGTPPPFAWAVNGTHTIQLKVNGTAITMYIDGQAYAATDGAIAAAGQAGFRVTQGMQCTNFTVQ